MMKKREYALPCCKVVWLGVFRHMHTLRKRGMHCVALAAFRFSYEVPVLHGESLGTTWQQGRCDTSTGDDG